MGPETPGPQTVPSPYSLKLDQSERHRARIASIQKEKKNEPKKGLLLAVFYPYYLCPITDPHRTCLKSPPDTISVRQCFSPDGRVFHIEYVAKAVENSFTLVGLGFRDGVVLAVQKTVVSKILLHGSMRRAHVVNVHAVLAMCGLISDRRVIVDRVRNECEQYRKIYARAMPSRVLVARLASFVNLYALYGRLRPFGCAIQLAVVGDDGMPDCTSSNRAACATVTSTDGTGKVAVEERGYSLRLTVSDVTFYSKDNVYPL